MLCVKYKLKILKNLNILAYGVTMLPLVAMAFSFSVWILNGKLPIYAQYCKVEYRFYEFLFNHITNY